MAKSETKLSPQGDPMLSAAAALSGRPLAVFVDQDLTHPQRAMAASALSFSRTFNSAVTALEASEAWMVEEGETLQILARSMRETAYAASEFFETLIQSIPESLTKNLRSYGAKEKRDFRSKAKRYQDGWKLLCNKCKHNHNVIVAARYSYAKELATNSCFSLLKPDGLDALTFNKDYHRGQERCRSARMMLLQVVADISRVDELLAMFIAALPDNPSVSPIASHSIAIGIRTSLDTLLSKPVYSAPNSVSMYDRPLIVAGDNVILFNRAQASFPTGQVKITMTYQGDGITRSFPMI